MKAIAYLRVSTEDQTVENQRLALQSWAAANAYQIAAFFEDPAVSGKVPATDREGFRSMLELLRSEKVDAVLVYELSRVGRTFWDTLRAIQVVERYAPLIPCSPKEAFLQTTDPSIRKLLVSIISWVAEREREVLVQRVKTGIARARAEGVSMGRPAKEIDWEKFKTYAEKGLATYKIAPLMGVTSATLYNRLKRYGAI